MVYTEITEKHRQSDVYKALDAYMKRYGRDRYGNTHPKVFDLIADLIWSDIISDASKHKTKELK